MDTILGIVSAFLGGCLLTSLGFVASSYGKQTQMQADIKSIKESLSAHIAQGNQPCPFHTQVVSDIAVLQSESGIKK